jgi:NitT/TauT family transport system substrate-binding protein
MARNCLGSGRHFAPPKTPWLQDHRRMNPKTLAPALLLALATSAIAAEPFSFATNWTAQAEHGGYYQALATGLYRQAGLDVSLRMGGPQVNSLLLLASGQVDCILGASDLQMIKARESGLPVVTVAAMFQKDPEVLIAHDNVRSFEDMRGKTILVSSAGRNGFWPWLKARYGFTDEQLRPYTFNIQPFLADHNIVQQGYATAEPFSIRQAGVKVRTFLFSDYGYPGYSNTISCLEKTLRERPRAVAAFVHASALGWKGYLADPAPGNELIRRDNPTMTAEQLAYSVESLRKSGTVTGGDALREGIGTITEARTRATFEFMVAAHLVDPQRVALAKTFTRAFAGKDPVLP